MEDVIECQKQIDNNFDQIINDLSDLVSIPSIGFPGHDPKFLTECALAVQTKLIDAGLENTKLIDIGSDAPLIYGTKKSYNTDAPDVLLYAHYDVQPAPSSQDWSTDPFTPIVKNGRLYGRGAADDKSGIALILAALRAPGITNVNIKVVIEGEEEYGSPSLPSFMKKNEELFRSDATIILDSGNTGVDQPAIDAGLRGLSACLVEVETLSAQSHSGLFGGPAPDALRSLIKLLNTIHYDDGSIAVEGLTAITWPDKSAFMDADDFARAAGVLNANEVLRPDELVSQLWCEPSITIIGIDAPTVDAPNSIPCKASAKVSLRTAPDADPNRELQTLIDHLQNHAKNIGGLSNLRIKQLENANGFLADVENQYFKMAQLALQDAYGGTQTTIIGSGGSIPIVYDIATINPDAATILIGAQEMSGSRIHASDESVHLGELRNCAVALCLLLQRMGNE